LVDVTGVLSMRRGRRRGTRQPIARLNPQTGQVARPVPSSTARKLAQPFVAQ
jgi:hypothetical protein